NASAMTRAVIPGSEQALPASGGMGDIEDDEWPRSGGMGDFESPMFNKCGAPLHAPLMCWVWQVEDRPDALHVQAPAEHEQREEAERDEEVTHSERQAALRRDRREDDEHALEEDGHEAHQRDDDERRVALRRPAGQTLDEVGERDEPAHREDHPGQRLPGLQEEAMDEE